MNITFAKYNTNDEGMNISINVIANGIKMSVPLDPENTEYAEIMRQVEAGELTIAPADEEE